MAGKGEWEAENTEDIQCIFLRSAALAAALNGGINHLNKARAVCSKCKIAAVTWERRGGNPVFVVEGEENCTQTVIR